MTTIVSFPGTDRTVSVAVSAGTANPLTAQFIQRHLADTPEPESPDTLCTVENLAGWPSPPSLVWSPVPSWGSLSPISVLDMNVRDWYDQFVDPPALPSPRALLLQEIQQPPVPPSPPPLAEIRVAAPLPFHRVEAPGAVVIPVYQDTNHVYQDKGFLMARRSCPRRTATG